MDIKLPIPILLYHKCPEDFGKQLEYIIDMGYTPVHLRGVADYLENPNTARRRQNLIAQDLLGIIQDYS